VECGAHTGDVASVERRGILLLPAGDADGRARLGRKSGPASASHSERMNLTAAGWMKARRRLDEKQIETLFIKRL